jgi:hypothetical protein
MLMPKIHEISIQGEEFPNIYYTHKSLSPRLLLRSSPLRENKK